MKQRWFEFVPAVFVKVMAATMAVVLIGFAVSAWVYGSIAVRDVIGAWISAVIFAYMVHLWIVMSRDSDTDREEP